MNRNEQLLKLFKALISTDIRTEQDLNSLYFYTQTNNNKGSINCISYWIYNRFTMINCVNCRNVNAIESENLQFNDFENDKYYIKNIKVTEEEYNQTRWKKTKINNIYPIKIDTSVETFNKIFDAKPIGKDYNLVKYDYKYRSNQLSGTGYGNIFCHNINGIANICCSNSKNLGYLSGFNYNCKNVYGFFNDNIKSSKKPVFFIRNKQVSFERYLLIHDILKEEFENLEKTINTVDIEDVYSSDIRREKTYKILKRIIRKIRSPFKINKRIFKVFKEKEIEYDKEYYRFDKKDEILNIVNKNRIKTLDCNFNKKEFDKYLTITNKHNNTKQVFTYQQIKDKYNNVRFKSWCKQFSKTGLLSIKDFSFIDSTLILNSNPEIKCKLKINLVEQNGFLIYKNNDNNNNSRNS